MSRRAFPWLTLAGLLVCPAALAGAGLHVVDADGFAAGLNERTPATPVGGNPGLTVGEQRLMSAQYAGALWSAVLGNQVPVSVRVSFTDLDCSGSTAVRGSAGPTKLFDDSRLAAALANERAGYDLDPGREEIEASFNARLGRPDCDLTSWYTGFDNQAPSGTTDLASVLLHELAHGLGFIKSSVAFRDQAKDATSGLLLSQLAPADYDAAVRRSLGVSWVGASVRARKDSVLTRSDGVLRLPDGRNFPLARARFGPGHVSVTAPVVLAQDLAGDPANDACAPIVPSPGALVLAERMLRPDGGLVCFVAQRALNAQAAGAVGLVVRNRTPGTGPVSYSGDAGPDLAIPVWGISYEDGAALEQLLASAPTTVTVDADGRRAGENLAGDVLLYTPDTYSEGSSVGHWDPAATPDLLMEPNINPHLSRDLDLTPAALQDVGWSPATGLSIAATPLGPDLKGTQARFLVQVINLGASTATDVVLDARPPSGVSLQSTALDCTGGMPCALGDLAPGTLKTVIAVYAIPWTARQVAVQFLLSGSPAPPARDASATAVASRVTGCSSTGTGAGGPGALLALALWAARRRPRRRRGGEALSPSS